jgi:hypothetical protein
VSVKHNYPARYQLKSAPHQSGETAPKKIFSQHFSHLLDQCVRRKPHWAMEMREMFKPKSDQPVPITAPPAHFHAQAWVPMAAGHPAVAVTLWRRFSGCSESIADFRIFRRFFNLISPLFGHSPFFEYFSPFFGPNFAES